MSTKTPNFDLLKPELTDAADITAYNQNWDEVDKQLAIANLPFVATSTDGIAYTATIPGITELYNGLTITVIPNMNSVQANITLDLNGLGAKNIRMTLPFSSGNSGALATVNTWFSADAPITLRYHEKMNTWKSDLQRQSAQDLYGSVPIENGGTGGTTIAEALSKLAEFDANAKPSRFPLVFPGLKETKLVTADCTTLEVFNAMPLNSSVAFTINTNDYDVNITDAPFINSAGNSYGFCILWQGRTINYRYGLMWDIYGDMYYCKYHTGTSLETNGWHKVCSEHHSVAPKVNNSKKLTAPGYYFIKFKGDIDLDYSQIDLGITYWDGANQVVSSGLYKQYHLTFYVDLDGTMHILKQNTATGNNQVDITDKVTFYVASTKLI